LKRLKKINDGSSENAVRIQIYSAIIAYCMVAIVEHDLQLNRSTYEVLRIFSASLLDKTFIKTLFFDEEIEVQDDRQLSLNFLVDTSEKLSIVIWLLYLF